MTFSQVITMPSVLFVCTANRFRSPIAEACFRELLRQQESEQNWQVGSAGIWTKPGLSALPSPEWSRESLGLDLSGHRSQPVSQHLLESYDLILVMEHNQKEALGIEFPQIRSRLFLLSKFSGGPEYSIADPVKTSEQTQTDYLEGAQELLSLVQASFQAICSQAAMNGSQQKQ
jgi:protein-tyrosine-phosphatase